MKNFFVKAFAFIGVAWVGLLICIWSSFIEAYHSILGHQRLIIDENDDNYDAWLSMIEYKEQPKILFRTFKRLTVLFENGDDGSQYGVHFIKEEFIDNPKKIFVHFHRGEKDSIVFNGSKDDLLLLKLSRP